MEKFKEKVEDIWYDISYFYPNKIRDLWLGVKRFFRNLKRYRYILWKDNDFDYGYLDEIIMLKLKFMANYFRTSRIAVGSEKWYDEILLAIRLCEIFSEKEDFGYKSNGEIIYYYPGYVNTKNINKFMPTLTNEHLKRIDEDEDFGKLIKTELRKRKARHLFFRLLRDYEENWWD